MNTRLGRSVLSCFIGPLMIGASVQAAPLPQPAGFEPFKNISAGGFTFYNRLQTGLKATSNVRLDPSAVSDVMKLLAIDSAARSQWQRHALAATFSYVDQQANKIKEQKNDALSLTLSGRIDLNEQLGLKLGALSIESIVGKNDPMQFNGALNATNHIDTLEAALEWKNAGHFANILARQQKIANETQINVSFLDRLQAQNRTEQNLTLQLGENHSWGQRYLLVGPERVTYTGSAVILPEDRDSTGVRLGAGLEYQQGPWQGVFRLIGFRQDFNAPTIPDISSWVGTAQLNYRLNPQWSLAGALERSFDETNIENSGGLFTNLATIGALYQPRQDFYLKLSPTYRFYEIADTGVEAESISLDATAAWQVTPRVELLLDLTLSDQTVNNAMISNLEYSESAITLSTVITY
ncbi:MAG: outer membrane beta-barrel protein [Gammaproteobacteria bacterium]|nr:outer membrane beta-barrel protein [Gammaproteobacteria bacterium]